MKNFVAVSLIMAGMVLIGGFFTFTQAQSSGIDAKPTVISPTPGLYVNGWPPFTVSYPKDWAEQRVQGPGEVFRAAALRPPLPPSPTLAVVTFGNSADISGAANMLAGIFGSIGFKDVKVLYDKPSKLQDGTPAQEAEIEFVPPNAPKINGFLLTTKKDGAWIMITMYGDKGMIGEDVKSIAYSLKVSQGKQEPVKVPPDVQAFLDKWNSDIDSHDVARIMSNLSDQFRQSGMDKKAVEGWFRTGPDSPVQLGITSAATTVTIFEPQGDKAYLAGFQTGNPKSGAPGPHPSYR